MFSLIFVEQCKNNVITYKGHIYIENHFGSDSSSLCARDYFIEIVESLFEMQLFF